LLFYPAMRGPLRNIAISLALWTLAVTGVAGTAEAKGGGKLGAAAVKMSRGAQIRLNRMTQKMSLRPKGTLAPARQAKDDARHEPPRAHRAQQGPAHARLEPP
jgi:hypothetical protein